jgi:hypothetical protein
LGFLCPLPVGAQTNAARLGVEVATGAAELQLGGVLGDERFRDALAEGLPIRIRVVTELWRDGFLDSQLSRVEWRATVLQDPLDGSFRLAASGGGAAREQVLGSVAEIGRALEAAFTPPPPPVRPGRHYYLATLEVETLSLSDLEELRRWLRGDLAAGIQEGRRGVEGALARGVGRFMQRALGLPALRVRLQSPPFDYPPEG